LNPSAGSASSTVRARWIVAGWVAAVLAVTVGAEWSMGRLIFGPDGHFGFLESNIWSREQSQRLIDPYSASHVVHGVLFYAFFWLVARRVPARYRVVAAVCLEAGWEILENSPVIINRYRAVTISLGYEGDSILNSVSDVLMMSIGYLVASRVRPWMAAALVLVFEIGMVLLVRDNLTLNILMLIYPVAAIRTWQMAGQPAGSSK
jgi:hypothetical protein